MIGLWLSEIPARAGPRGSGGSDFPDGPDDLSDDMGLVDQAGIGLVSRVGGEQADGGGLGTGQHFHPLMEQASAFADRMQDADFMCIAARSRGHRMTCQLARPRQYRRSGQTPPARQSETL